MLLSILYFCSIEKKLVHGSLYRNSTCLWVLFLFSLYCESFGKDQNFRLQREYCALLTQCNIEASEQYCPASSPELRKPLSNLNYKEQVCVKAQSLLQSGVSQKNWMGKNLYGLLGSEHQITFQIKEELPISIQAFRYLLNDIPFSAKVVNAFRKTKYTVQYIKGSHKKHWKGDDGKRLKGEAKLIAGTPDKDNLTYFGKGTVTILYWNIRGPVLFDIKYTPNPNKPNNSIQYELNILAFPGNGIIHSIMSLGFFERTVQKKIHKVFKDITFSAKALNKTPYPELLKKYTWTTQEKLKLQHLKNIPL